MNKPRKSVVESASAHKPADAGAKPNEQAADPKGTRTATAKRPARAKQDAPIASRTSANGPKLVCRYCGSDDLAPSFAKRRDARCRACFKQRYRMASRKRKGARIQSRNAKSKNHAKN